MLTYRQQQEKVDEYLAMKSVHSGLRRQLQFGLGLVHRRILVAKEFEREVVGFLKAGAA